MRLIARRFAIDPCEETTDGESPEHVGNERLTRTEVCPMVHRLTHKTHLLGWISFKNGSLRCSLDVASSGVERYNLLAEEEIARFTGTKTFARIE